MALDAKSGDAPEREALFRSAMTHEGCGGTYEKKWNRGGLRWAGFICSRCEDEVEVDFGEGPNADFKAWQERQPKYEAPTSCGAYHVPSQPRGDGVCYCGAVRFRSDDCPTCGQEWDREEPVTP